MALKRATNWQTLLHEFLVDRARMPFAWGGNDCCTFPADAIKAMTGEDIAAAFRGAYTGEAGAWAAVMRMAGGSGDPATAVADAAAWCAAKAGMPEWMHAGKAAPLLAQRGDLVVLPESGRLIAGIVHLNGSAVAAVGAAGLKLLPLMDVQRAWHY
jgi:hypothetical protein